MTREPVLAVVFLTWCSIGLAGAVFAIRRAPAVTLALFGWVLGGVGGFAIARLVSEHHVPQNVALGSSIGLVALAMLGVFATTATPPARTLKLAAAWVALASPFAIAGTTLSLLYACPMYVRGGYCHYDFDMLGGWLSGVVILLTGDLAVLVLTLMWSARQARPATSPHDHDAPGRTILMRSPSDSVASP